MKPSHDIYSHRALTEGFPSLEQLGVKWFAEYQRIEKPAAGGIQTSNLRSVVNCPSKLVDLSSGENTICEIGCGPNPYTLQELRRLSFQPVGIEPILGYVQAARIKLEDPEAVLQGTAEKIPLNDESQRFVILKSVLEQWNLRGSLGGSVSSSNARRCGLYLYNQSLPHFAPRRKWGVPATVLQLVSSPGQGILRLPATALRACSCQLHAAPGGPLIWSMPKTHF